MKVWWADNVLFGKIEWVLWSIGEGKPLLGGKSAIVISAIVKTSPRHVAGLSRSQCRNNNTKVTNCQRVLTGLCSCHSHKLSWFYCLDLLSGKHLKPSECWSSYFISFWLQLIEILLIGPHKKEPHKRLRFCYGVSDIARFIAKT